MRLKVGATSSYSLPDPPQADTGDLQRAQADLAALANEMPNVAVRALNATMKGTHTDIKKVIRAEYHIKAGVIDSRIKIGKRASRHDISGYVRSQGYHIGLTTDLDAKEMALQTPRGVEVNIKKDTGKQLLSRAFIRPGLNSGKLIVLRRPGNPPGQHMRLYGRYGPEGSGGGPRGTLDAFYGPHPENLINHPENWAKIQGAIGTRLDSSIDREIKAEFRRLEGKW